MASLEECDGIGVAALQSSLRKAMRLARESLPVLQLEQCHKLIERAGRCISALDEKKRTEQSLELDRGLRRLERIRQQVAIFTHSFGSRDQRPCPSHQTVGMWSRRGGSSLYRVGVE